MTSRRWDHLIVISVSSEEVDDKIADWSVRCLPRLSVLSPRRCGCAKPVIGEPFWLRSFGGMSVDKASQTNETAEHRPSHVTPNWQPISRRSNVEVEDILHHVIVFMMSKEIISSQIACDFGSGSQYLAFNSSLIWTMSLTGSTKNQFIFVSRILIALRFVWYQTLFQWDASSLDKSDGSSYWTWHWLAAQKNNLSIWKQDCYRFDVCVYSTLFQRDFLPRQLTIRKFWTWDWLAAHKKTIEYL